MREKFFLPVTVAVCMLISFGWYEFVYEPTQREILSMQLETRRLREVEREIAELKARHENLSALAAAKERQLDAARNFLPPTLMTDRFIDELYRAAEFNRVRLTSVQAGEEVADAQSQIVTVNLSASYVELLNFIRAIIDGERQVGLENFSITADNSGTLTCEVNFKIFADVPAADHQP